MRLTVGHTPDADDAFMFYAMLEGRVPTPGFEVEHVVEDIESLNRKAGGAPLDVTAVSVHACAHLPGYTVLRSGGSFGLGYGPVVVAAAGRGPGGPGSLAGARVAVPGRLTSAALLLRLMAGEYEAVEVNFSEVPAAVASGRADAGLVIHEAQLSYEGEGLRRVADLGEWWDGETGGLPVPLGVNVMRTSLGPGAVASFDACLRESILYARGHEDEALGYAMRYARGRPRELISRFVRMYVNDRTVEMGGPGEEAVRRMLSMAGRAGLVPAREPEIAPPGAGGARPAGKYGPGGRGGAWR